MALNLQAYAGNDFVVAGDMNDDCKVELRDFAELAYDWVTEEGEGGYNHDCDISIPADDNIDILDAEIVFRNWLAGR